MKRLIQFTFLLAGFMLGSSQVMAQQVVSISELNAYDDLTEFDASVMSSHPLVGTNVQFTAVVVSYPQSSGLATPTDDNGDGVIDRISRIHVFVTDTAAVTEGRAGMSIQLVESDYTLLEGLVRGDVVTFTGALSFFNATSQMTVETVDVLGNVNAEYPDYAGLLDPWEITADELNTLNADGTHEINIANYSKYNGAYVKLTNATVSNVSTGDRPDWAVNNNGSRVYVYDTSLRFRNDRVAYLPSYNYRHGDDPEFVPPVPGAVVNLSGFVNLVGDDPDGNVAPDKQAFSINPFEDGVLWTGGERFEDGETIPGVGVLDWPSDLEIVGLPPVFSEAMLSDSTAGSSDDITVSVNVVGANAKTVTSVDMVYMTSDTTDTLSMTAAGDVYSAVIPAQPNFTAVSFYFIATDSDGLVGRDPIAGNYGYFVQDGAINTISLIQTTPDGGPGASPVAGAGVLEYDLTGMIVADNATDGVIILQDTAAAWSGIFLEHTTETDALLRGDEITVTAAEIVEAAVASNSLTLSQMTNITFTKNSSGNDIESVIPTITTDTVIVLTQNGELENYEGMVVKFDKVEVIDRGNYGEYTLRNIGADSTSGAIFNEDIRASGTIGDVNVSYDFNHAIRMGVTMDAYAVVAASFGAPKFHPRNATDFVAEDGNAFTPVLDFPLTAPVDSAEVSILDNVEFAWTATEDFDGDDVSYMFAIYSAADTSLLSMTDAIEGTSVTFTAVEVDSFLVAEGIADGDTGEFLWTVMVTDGSDTLQVHGAYGNFGDDFMPLFRTIMITNSLEVSNEELGGPLEFELKQNYPNPFNPTTNINFSLPQSSKVTLTVFDMLGRKVATLIDGKQMQAAKHSVKFNASALASGMYIYRIEAGTFVSTRKMMLIK